MEQTNYKCGVIGGEEILIIDAAPPTVEVTSARRVRHHILNLIGFRRPHAPMPIQSNAGVTAATIVSGRPIN
jgi:hypothetical protein